MVLGTPVQGSLVLGDSWPSHTISSLCLVPEECPGQVFGNLG